MEAIMKNIDRSLFGTLLFLFGAAVIPLFCDYGHFSVTPKIMLLSMGAMLVGSWLWFTGMICEHKSAAIGQQLS